MTALALVDHEGRVFGVTPTIPVPQVEKPPEDLPLHIVAEREHAKQSTKIKETK